MIQWYLLTQLKGRKPFQFKGRQMLQLKKRSIPFTALNQLRTLLNSVDQEGDRYLPKGSNNTEDTKRVDQKSPSGLLNPPQRSTANKTSPTSKLSLPLKRHCGKQPSKKNIHPL